MTHMYIYMLCKKNIRISQKKKNKRSKSGVSTGKNQKQHFLVSFFSFPFFYPFADNNNLSCLLLFKKKKRIFLFLLLISFAFITFHSYIAGIFFFIFFCCYSFHRRCRCQPSSTFFT